jgi:hypothetical protein
MPPGRPRREARPRSIARARAGEPWDVEVRLPPAWFYLSCDKATDGRQVPVSVDERIAIEPAIEPYRELLVESLLGWSATAARGGSAGAALRFGIEDRGEMVLATLTIERLERDRGEPAAELANLRPLVERQIDSDEYPPRVTEFSLPIGRALRMQAVREPTSGSGPAPQLRLVVDFWVPVAEVVTLLFRFGTGALGHAGILCQEFDTIATAFTFGVTD